MLKRGEERGEGRGVLRIFIFLGPGFATIGILCRVSKGKEWKGKERKRDSFSAFGIGVGVNMGLVLVPERTLGS
jgi:hypothetical protein